MTPNPSDPPRAPPDPSVPPQESPSCVSNPPTTPTRSPAWRCSATTRVRGGPGGSLFRAGRFWGAPLIAESRVWGWGVSLTLMRTLWGSNMGRGLWGCPISSFLNPLAPPRAEEVGGGGKLGGLPPRAAAAHGAPRERLRHRLGALAGAVSGGHLGVAGGSPMWGSSHLPPPADPLPTPPPPDPP